MNIQRLKVADIIPSPYNPRVALEKGSAKYKQIENSINEFGFVEPLVVNLENMHLVGGHQRLAVLKDMQVEEVEVVAINEPDQHREQALCVALNKIDGDWDMQKLAELLSDDDVQEFFTGFEAGEVDLSMYLDDAEDIDIPSDEEADTEESSDVETEEEGTTLIKVGTFRFVIKISEYEELLNSIRDMGIFDQDGIKDEMRRRLLNDTDSTD